MYADTSFRFQKDVLTWPVHADNNRSGPAMEMHVSVSGPGADSSNALVKLCCERVTKEYTSKLWHPNMSHRNEDGGYKTNMHKVR